jgi:serine/threonine-protein kinase
VREGLGTRFDGVILRALDKDPHRRWHTAGAFRHALLEAHHGGEEPDRILIADDDPDWSELLSRALGERFPDAEIDTVRDGDAAIHAFEERPYAAVLVDLEMPEVDGMELTKWLRARGVSEKTPIIVMTAAGGPGEWRRLSRLGADAFLVKPVEPEDVATVIRRTLRARRARVA